MHTDFLCTSPNYIYRYVFINIYTYINVCLYMSVYIHTHVGCTLTFCTQTFCVRLRTLYIWSCFHTYLYQSVYKYMLIHIYMYVPTCRVHTDCLCTTPNACSYTHSLFSSLSPLTEYLPSLPHSLPPVLPPTLPSTLPLNLCLTRSGRTDAV